MQNLQAPQSDCSFPVLRAQGFFFVADPHVAATPPMDRQGMYRSEILHKLRFCLEKAQKADLVPVFLGDLFHWPRENPSDLLKEVMELFEPYVPWVLVGNHDRSQGWVVPDASVKMLDNAGAIHLIDKDGPVVRLETPTRSVLLGASPDGYRLPTVFPSSPDITVIWISHHNVAFSDFREKPVPLREIPGVDWVVNGHIHRPQPSERKGQTLWTNPGNITRLVCNRRTKEREPAATIWRPECKDLVRVRIPHLPFEQVFPDMVVSDEEKGRPGS